jgi:hypothetical protein
MAMEKDRDLYLKQRQYRQRQAEMTKKAIEANNKTVTEARKKGKRGKNKITIAKEKAMYGVFYDYFKTTYLEKMKGRFDAILETQARVAAEDFGHQDRRMVLQVTGLLGDNKLDNQSKVETAGKLLSEIFGDDKNKDDNEYEKE